MLAVEVAGFVLTRRPVDDCARQLRRRAGLAWRFDGLRHAAEAHSDRAGVAVERVGGIARPGARLGVEIDRGAATHQLAALSVLVVHYCGVFFAKNLSDIIHVAPVGIARPAWLDWIFSPPYMNLGPFGVGIFFLVSGFVIPFSLSKLEAVPFLVARFFRLWPTYAVGFTISLIALFFLYQSTGDTWSWSLVDIGTHYLISVRDLVGRPQIDGVVWTLEIEVKFYLVCALAAPLFRRHSLAVLLIPVAIIAAFLAVRWQADVLYGKGSPVRGFVLASMYAAPYVVFMFIGTVFHYLHIGRITAQRAMFFVAGIYCALILTVLSGPYAVRINEFWNYGFSLVVFAFAAAFPHLFRSTRVGDFFAGISYPLYVVHNIVGYTLFRVLLKAGVALHTTLAIMVATAIGLAWLLHVAVELPSQAIGKRVSTKLNG